MVVRHPGNGREILFVNPSHTHGFVGMRRDEATALINALTEHATQPGFVYHHRWRVGDLVIWDEVSTMHKGAAIHRPTSAACSCARSCHPATPYWTAAEH